MAWPAFSPESQTALEEIARLLVPFWINIHFEIS
jgi:hypothetical protein